jgi:hypothetical protein
MGQSDTKLQQYYNIVREDVIIRDDVSEKEKDDEVCMHENEVQQEAPQAPQTHKYPINMTRDEMVKRLGEIELEKALLLKLLMG